jgi:hypothetical protein
VAQSRNTGRRRSQERFKHVGIWTERKRKIDNSGLANWIKKEDLVMCCLQETLLIDRSKHLG